MLSLREALDKAALYLADNCAGLRPEDVRVMHEAAYVDGAQAVVPYNHVGFLDGGQRGKQLLGNIPIVVDLTSGACRLMTWDEFFADMDGPRKLG